MTICVIGFVPNIYESNAVDRNNYIKNLVEIAKTNRKQPFTFFWLQAGDQLDLERNLGLGFGFPAVVAVSPAKSLYATMRSAFSNENVNTFLTKVITGSSPTDPLPKGGFTVKKVSKWDGKDAAPIIEENYEL